MPDSIYKRDIINFLFVISFPMYGVGLYVAAVYTPSAGYFVCSLVYILILLFHLVDILYKRDIALRVGANYWLLLLYLLSFVVSLAVAARKNLPGADLSMFVIRSVLIVAPLHAFIVVYIYNMRRDAITGLTLTGLSLLLLINVFAYYVLGITNQLHNIQGRVNLPFLDGLYSGACLIAIINLMLFYRLRRVWSTRPITSFFIILYFSINLLIFFDINSRLVTAVLILVVLLMIFNISRTFKGVFSLSLLTLPLLLSGGLVIYKILSLPFFAAIMRRVELYDVLTFNGRSFLWQSGVDWLLEDQRGLVFGNGYKGHYFLNLFSDVVNVFDIKAVHDMHMHSTTLEILVSQGLFGLALYVLASYKAFQYYKAPYRNGEKEGAFLPVLILLLFVAHIDGFVYMNNLGAMLFALLVSRIAVSYTTTSADNTFAFGENGRYATKPSLP